MEAVYETPGIAGLSVSGSTLAITGDNEGSTKVTVTASYPGHEPGTAEFNVTVADGTPQINVQPINDKTILLGKSTAVEIHTSTPRLCGVGSIRNPRYCNLFHSHRYTYPVRESRRKHTGNRDSK